MVCNQCGKELIETDKFCSHCGKATENTIINDVFADVNEEENVQPSQQNQQTPESELQSSEQPQATKLPKLTKELKILLKPYISQYKMQLFKYRKMISISAVLLLVMIAGLIVFNSLTPSPEKTAQKALDAFMNQDVEAFIENTTFNKKVYEELRGDEYDEDSINNKLVDSILNNGNAKFTFEIDEVVIIKGDDFDIIIEHIKNRIKNTDCIDSISSVNIIIKYEVSEETEEDQMTLNCYKIDGEWYMDFGF